MVGGAAIHHAQAIATRPTAGESEADDEAEGFGQPGERERRVLWGSQFHILTGGLSSYQAYRTALWTHKARFGGYRFIRRQESMREILTAPLRFDFLKRSTTLWPLGIALGLHVLSMASVESTEGLAKDRFTWSDAFFSTGISYNAGVGEEPFFRGFLMAELREATGSDFVSNGLQSVLFAAAHLATVERPFAQLALGYYWGHLTQKNNWEISESIFIHTWWDVIALLTVFQIVEK
jgi:membrane protease YdiL (CAAX protease family)